MMDLKPDFNIKKLNYVQFQNLPCGWYDGEYVVGWQTVDGNKYYFREDGSAVVKNTVINGIRYKFGKDGVCKGKYSGWVKKSGKYYYYKNGEIRKNCWLKVKGKKTYYLTEDGSRAVGTVEIAGKTYSFDKNGKLQTNWRKSKHVIISTKTSKSRLKQVLKQSWLWCFCRFLATKRLFGKLWPIHLNIF